MTPFARLPLRTPSSLSSRSPSPNASRDSWSDGNSDSEGAPVFTPVATPGNPPGQVVAALGWWHRLDRPAPMPRPGHGPHDADPTPPTFADHLQRIEARAGLADSPAAQDTIDRDLAALAGSATTHADLDRLLTWLDHAPADMPCPHLLRSLFRETARLHEETGRPHHVHREESPLGGAAAALSRLAHRFAVVDRTEQEILIACYIEGQSTVTAIHVVLATLGLRADPVWTLPGAADILEGAGLHGSSGLVVVHAPWSLAAQTAFEAMGHPPPGPPAPFMLTALPDELIQHVVHLCGPNLHDLIRQDRCLRDIRAIVRLSATNHAFQQRTTSALQLAFACALRLKWPFTTEWRLSRLSDADDMVLKLLKPPVSLSGAECLLWMLHCAVAMPNVGKVQQALNLVDRCVSGSAGRQRIGGTASVDPSLSVLLAHVIRRTLIASTDCIAQPWQLISARILLHRVLHLPHEEAVSVLIELAAAMDGHADHDDQSLDALTDRGVQSIRWVHLVELLQIIDPGADESLLAVSALNRLESHFRTRSLGRITQAHIDDALECLMAHPYRFMGATATALSILERCELTREQARRLATCVRKADARGPWRFFL